MINFSVDKTDYFNHHYNGTIHNERAIELVLAERYIHQYKPIIEIGAVMPYYGFSSHETYDPFDAHPSAIKKFAEEIDITNKNILSVSTIEHFGEGDCVSIYKGVEGNKSFLFLNKLNLLAKSYFVTLPIGWNKEMDKSIKDNISKFSWVGYFKTNNSPSWEICKDIEKITSFEYGRPFTSANSIICLYKDIL